MAVGYLKKSSIDAVKVIDHCWSNTSTTLFSHRLQCGLRVVRLYSSDGDISLREPFESLMQKKRWRTKEREFVKVNGRQMQPGIRDYWYIAIRMQTPLVEECLNEIGI